MSRNGRFTARPLSRRTPAPPINREEDRAIDSVDRLALFEQWEKDIMPVLKEAMAAMKDPKQILEIGKAAASVRLVLMAQQGNMAAIKELLDRTEGKVVEKKAIVHAMAEVKEEQLDALLLSLGEADDGDAS